MKKRIVSLCTGIFLLTAILTGCSMPFGDGFVKGTVEDENTLTVWCWGQESYVYAMEEAEKLYQKDHSEFQLIITEHSMEEIKEALLEASASQNVTALPDLLLVNDSIYRESEISCEKVLQDLEKSSVNYDDFQKNKVEAVTVEGKHYGVPFDYGTVLMYMRTDILEKAGFTIDDFSNITWEELLEKGKVVKEKTGKALLATMAEGDVVEQYAGSVYGELKSSGVSIEVNTLEQYKAALTKGDVAAAISENWIVASVMTEGTAEGQWAVVSVPVSGTNQQKTVIGDSGNSWSVTANCEKQELAYDFLAETFGSSEELYELLMKNVGLLGSYLPIQSCELYYKPQDFFGKQTYFRILTDYTEELLQDK